MRFLKKLFIKQYTLDLNNGQAGLTVVVLFLFISIGLIAGASSLASKDVKAGKVFSNSKKSYFLAESGVEDVVYRIKRGKNVSSSGSIFTPDGQVNIIVSSPLGGNKEIVATADILGYVRKIKAVLSSAYGFEFFYGVEVGEGGLEMDENSAVIGNIYSNGSVTGENGSKISGDAIVATNIEESGQVKSAVCNQDQLFGQVNPVVDMAQSFIAPQTGKLAKISIYIKKVSNPSNRTIRITGDSSGSPDENNVFASATLSASLVTTEYGWIDVVFLSPPMLVNGNTYWIVFDASRSSTKYWYWCSDSNNGYGNGIGKYSEDWDNDPWTQITGDLNFRTYWGSGINFIDNIIVTGDAKSNTITNSKICGDAYYQSIDSASLDFLNSPSSPTCLNPLTPGIGYLVSSDQPYQGMPISDANIESWKTDASVGGQVIGDLSVISNISLGPKEITGNLMMTSNNKILTITGTVYVHGYIDIANGSTIQCDPSYGANSCIVIADSWIHTENNSNFRGSGETGSYLMMLTTSNCDGTSGIGCTHHNGAVDIHNNASGVIFYAQNGMINLHNGVNVTEIIAYKLRLDNTAVVTYEQGLADLNFSAGPSGAWDIVNWREVE
ncbi:MAG: hypothetical protein NUV64_02835 [Parcubacteria group bacterium]|nr:hypothetical protein [Parcubacteria group bacterium]MCR4342949.1 hypothetical protein [Patescibacteria group bacterium]